MSHKFAARKLTATDCTITSTPPPVSIRAMADDEITALVARLQAERVRRIAARASAMTAAEILEIPCDVWDLLSPDTQDVFLPALEAHSLAARADFASLGGAQ
jgi:hypothetical protein